jgi:four helix bundle protein
MYLEDLKVYNQLVDLVLEIHQLTLSFPIIERFELGSQLRRSSNSAPANLAECFGNKHTKIYLEGISRAQGEIRESVHHLKIAMLKNYISEEDFHNYKIRYIECSKMLFGLEKSLARDS